MGPDQDFEKIHDPVCSREGCMNDILYKSKIHRRLCRRRLTYDLHWLDRGTVAESTSRCK